MDPYDEEALSALRLLSRQFIHGKVAFEDFYGIFRMAAHRLFNVDQDSMPEQIAQEVEFYLRWEGFGCREGHVPQNAHWRYGDPEPFGWIDKRAFARNFADEYRRLVSLNEGDA